MLPIAIKLKPLTNDSYGRLGVSACSKLLFLSAVFTPTKNLQITSHFGNERMAEDDSYAKFYLEGATSTKRNRQLAKLIKLSKLYKNKHEKN